MKNLFVTLLTTASLLASGTVLAAEPTINTKYGASEGSEYENIVETVSVDGAQYIYVAEYNKEGRMLSLKRVTADASGTTTVNYQFNPDNDLKIVATTANGITPVAENVYRKDKVEVTPTPTPSLTAEEQAKEELKNSKVEEANITTVDWSTSEPDPTPTPDTAVQQAKKDLIDNGVEEEKILETAW